MVVVVIAVVVGLSSSSSSGRSGGRQVGLEADRHPYTNCQQPGSEACIFSLGAGGCKLGLDSYHNTGFTIQFDMISEFKIVF